MPAGERTRQDFAKERQARTLVAAEGKDGAGRFGVEGLGVGRWSAFSVKHEPRRQLFTFVARHLDFTFGDS